MWSGFQAKKLNTRGELELELAANRAEPENQAELVPGLDPDQKYKFKNFFSKNQTYPIACSARERATWFTNICPKKGVFHLSH